MSTSVLLTSMPKVVYHMVIGLTVCEGPDGADVCAVAVKNGSIIL